MFSLSKYIDKVLSYNETSFFPGLDKIQKMNVDSVSTLPAASLFIWERTGYI